MQNQLNKEKVDLEAFATSDDNVVSAINYVNSIRSEDSNVTFLNTAFEYVINLKNEGIWAYIVLPIHMGRDQTLVTWTILSFTEKAFDQICRRKVFQSLCLLMSVLPTQ